MLTCEHKCDSEFPVYSTPYHKKHLNSKCFIEEPKKSLHYYHSTLFGEDINFIEIYYVALQE
jgi:DNA-binding protein Fis